MIRGGGFIMHRRMRMLNRGAVFVSVGEMQEIVELCMAVTSNRTLRA